jgi:hypothetical protein
MNKFQSPHLACSSATSQTLLVSVGEESTFRLFVGSCQEVGRLSAAAKIHGKKLLCLFFKNKTGHFRNVK